MLRHTGDKRNFKHNLRLASLLCLNAGFINGAGFLAFQVLTTNVTGHAALLAVNLAQRHWMSAVIAASWLLLFLFGAFCSAFIISRIGRSKPTAYTIPITIIILLVLSIAITGRQYHALPAQTELFAGVLLFAMGMQNALVSVISGSVVRTTHLTGMFTDLGIDLSALVSGNRNQPTKKRVLLRLTIISFFLAGGLIGSIVFNTIDFHAFYIPCIILTTALFYDYFRIHVVRALRKQ